MKNFGLVFGIIGAVVITGGLVGGVYMLTRGIYNSNSCTYANIDNIELRTGINVPAITDVECECSDNNKTSSFVIDTEEVNLDEYIMKQEFELVDNIYQKKGTNDHTVWSAQLNPETAALSFQIEYLN